MSRPDVISGVTNVVGNGAEKPGKPLPKLAPQARGNDEYRGAAALSLPRLLRRLVFDVEVIPHAFHHALRGRFCT
jgi:hypothetical protein